MCQKRKDGKNTSHVRVSGTSEGTMTIEKMYTYLFYCAIGILLEAVPAAASPPKSIVYSSPIDRSSFVKPQTSIIIRSGAPLAGNAPSPVKYIRITGSQSGNHTASGIIAKDQCTMIFIPDKQFLPGENVTVQWMFGMITAALDTMGAFRFAFTISSREVTPADRASSMRRIAMVDPSYRGMTTVKGPPMLSKNARVKSPASTSENIPEVTIQYNDDPSTGGIYWSNVNLASDSLPSYLLITKNDGSLAEYLRMDAQCADFRPEPNGDYTFYDWGALAFYELDHTLTSLVKIYTCQQGFVTDQHDIKLLPNGHVLLLGQDPEYVDMSALVPGGNSSAVVYGLVIQEIDADDNVVFQWRSLDHYKITDALGVDLTQPTIDYLHANAIDLDMDGNILLSARHLDEITKIDRTTGDIIWRWGGINNQFTFINDSLGFSYQHDIRVLPNGNMTLFDNGNLHDVQISRACEYTLDQAAMTATLVWQYANPLETFSISMGSVQRLNNGNTLIGWGSSSSPAVTEVTPDGVKAFEMSLPDNVINYRAYRSDLPTLVDGTPVTTSPPDSYVLEQNFPNPFNPSTMINYVLPADDRVILKVYDIAGRVVKTLVDEVKPAGRYVVRFNGNDAAGGIYFCQMVTSHYKRTMKMMLVK